MDEEGLTSGLLFCLDTLHDEASRSRNCIYA
jgi:hypothetical protein